MRGVDTDDFLQQPNPASARPQAQSDQARVPVTRAGRGARGWRQVSLQRLRARWGGVNRTRVLLLTGMPLPLHLVALIAEWDIVGSTWGNLMAIGWGVALMYSFAAGVFGKRVPHDDLLVAGMLILVMVFGALNIHPKPEVLLPIPVRWAAAMDRSENQRALYNFQRLVAM